MGNKGTIHIHPVRQISADKARPALSCSDLAGLTLSQCSAGRLPLSPPNNEPEHEKSLWEVYLGLLADVSFQVEAHWAPTFLYFYSTLYQNKLKSFLLPVKCLLGEKLVNWRGRRVLSGFWPAPAPLHSLCLFLPSGDGVTACHCGCSTIRLRLPDYCGAQKKHQGLPHSFVHSFLSLFKAENQSAVHTHTQAHTYTRVPSFPFHLSIQQPVII